MIDIFDLYQTLLSIVNAQQNGNIRPWDFVNWVNAIQNEFHLENIKNFGENQVITDQLAAFTKYVNIIPVRQPGQPFELAPRPSDYVGFCTALINRQKDEDKCGCNPDDKYPIIDGNGKYYAAEDPDYAAMIEQYAGMNLIEQNLKIVPAKVWAGMLEHISKSASFDKPKITIYNQGFKLAPKGISVFTLGYFGPIIPVVFVYTIGTGDTIEYDASGSVQLNWPSNMKDDFIKALAARYFKYTRDGEGMQLLGMEGKVS